MRAEEGGEVGGEGEEGRGRRRARDGWIPREARDARGKREGRLGGGGQQREEGRGREGGSRARDEHMVHMFQEKQMINEGGGEREGAGQEMNTWCTCSKRSK